MKSPQYIHTAFRFNSIDVLSKSKSRFDLELFQLTEENWAEILSLDLSDIESCYTVSFLVDWFSRSDVIDLKTSGSTGVPKKVTISKASMLASARATANFFQLKQGTRALLALSVGYIAGKMMLVRAMLMGWHLDTVEPSSNPLKFIDCINDSAKNDSFYDFTALVPMQLANSLNDLSKVATVIIGGASISSELKHQLSLSTSNSKIYETYGMTETVSHVALRKLYPNSDIYFKALPKVTFSQDERSCLSIDASSLLGIRVTTNDMVNLIDSFAFEWLGRYDNVINSGGVKLFPEQIESKLSDLFMCNFMLTALPDVVLGNRLVLFLEKKTMSSEDHLFLDKSYSESKFVNRLERYQIPKEIYVLDEFLYTQSNKLKRKEILDRFMSDW